MLKRPIKYTDFNGQQQEDIYYFNLTQTELLEMETGIMGGMGGLLERIVETSDLGKMIKQFQELILRSYGEKSDDGKRFVKSEALREEFSQTAAYDALFTEFATNANAAITFIEGIMPADMLAAVKNQDKPTGPPPTPQRVVELPPGGVVNYPPPPSNTTDL